MVKVGYRDTYQAAKDTANVRSVVVACLLLGAALHSDLADCHILDALWMSGLLAGAVAALPQLGMISKAGGQTHGLTSHYIISCTLSRSLSGMVMWFAGDELTSEPWTA